MTRHKTLAMRSANAMLRSLLRTPKTRQGLAACVTTKGLTPKFVEGWLVERVRGGAVTKFESTDRARPLYQMSEFVADEKVRPSDYPAWLEPRAVPPTTSRAVYIGAKDISSPGFAEAPDTEEETCD